MAGEAVLMFFFAPSSADDANKRGKTTASKSTANHINNNRPVILSKTTTPLQRLQQKVRMEECALVQKRRNRRVENLVAMQLLPAPTAEMYAERLWKQKKATGWKTAGKRRREGDVDGDDAAGKDDDDDEDAINAMAIAGKIESERAHRCIATRGWSRCSMRYRSTDRRSRPRPPRRRRIGVTHGRRGGFAASLPGMQRGTTRAAVLRQGPLILTYHFPAVLRTSPRTRS